MVMYCCCLDRYWKISNKLTLRITMYYDVPYRVWNVDAMAHSACKVLPHPSFVYCAKYHTDIKKFVVTGGFDRLVRIWNLESEGSTAHVILLFYAETISCHVRIAASVCMSLQNWDPFHCYSELL